MMQHGFGYKRRFGFNFMNVIEKKSPVLNLAFYRFCRLPEDLVLLRKQVKERILQAQVRGTILLSPEGINGFIAGPEIPLRAFYRELLDLCGIEELVAKESWSDEIPFARPLVKIKKEIIALGMDAVRPDEHTGPRLMAAELREWLDQGRPVTLIDTRNDYEFRMGSFEGAVNLDLQTFRQFPERLKGWMEQNPSLLDRPVVMFCTGGIRCEKATAVGELLGIKQSFQLEGGILKYFEEVGGAHWRGGCFVFDERVQLNPDLTVGVGEICYACRAPLGAEELSSPQYVVEVSCPYCFERNAKIPAASC